MKEKIFKILKVLFTIILVFCWLVSCTSYNSVKSKYDDLEIKYTSETKELSKQIEDISSENEKLKLSNKWIPLYTDSFSVGSESLEIELRCSSEHTAALNAVYIIKDPSDIDAYAKQIILASYLLDKYIEEHKIDSLFAYFYTNESKDNTDTYATRYTHMNGESYYEGFNSDKSISSGAPDWLKSEANTTGNDIGEAGSNIYTITNHLLAPMVKYDFIWASNSRENIMKENDIVFVKDYKSTINEDRINVSIEKLSDNSYKFSMGYFPAEDADITEHEKKVAVVSDIVAETVWGICYGTKHQYEITVFDTINYMNITYSNDSVSAYNRDMSKTDGKMPDWIRDNKGNNNTKESIWAYEIANEIKSDTFSYFK